MTGEATPRPGDASLPPHGDRSAAFRVMQLLDVMRQLREPGGCPWDREQTLDSLQPFLVEETCELLEAMAAEDVDCHLDELGDVLLQVVFQARILEERGEGGFGQVVERLIEKLTRRHPHVFGDVVAKDSATVVRNWEAIKRRESGSSDRRSVLDGIPRALPALQQAQKIQKKASENGFDWDSVEPVAGKVAEEWAELQAAMADSDDEAVRHEVGDLLFSVVNLCRFLGVDAESSLRLATARFSRRFNGVEARVREAGKTLNACSLGELDAYWDDVKREGI